MPKPEPPASPEIVSHLMMGGRGRNGAPVNVGAGVTDRGGIALLNTASDGIAVVTVEGASDYLGLIRKILFEAIDQGQRR